jgi:Ser/Thr protein kinase RdoA (MazF antagonist)
MIALGVPDQRPQRLTALTTALVEDPALDLEPSQRDRLRATLGQYEGWCARLASSGIPASLNHDDLHDGNVLVGEGADRALRFFDWGDSAVAFPFTTLLVTLRVFADRFGLSADDARVLRVRDAYLDAYDDELDRAEIRELAQLATWTGKPGRALSWRRALTMANPLELAEHGDTVSGWLEELLSPGPL